MALLLDSIYKPLTDFFLKQFGTGTNTEICFRFDTNSVVSDENFREAGDRTKYSGPAAIEQFSLLVNNMPIENGDGNTISLSAQTIEAAYNYLLHPSLPIDPDPTSIFWSVKKNAVENCNAIGSSILGNQSQFFPSYAEPGNWYDQGQDDAWTPYNFQIVEPAQTPDPSTSQPILWKMKVEDSVLQKNVQITDSKGTASPMVSTNFINKPSPGLVANATVFPAMKTSILQHSTIRRADHVSPNLSPAAISIKAIAPTVQIQPMVSGPQNQLKFNDTLQLNHLINQLAVHQPVTTSNIKIAFEYCTVKIKRSWFDFGFINDQSWYVPGLNKGWINGTPWMFLQLPVAFVAIRKLVISTNNWSAQDIKTSTNAFAFGPFKINSTGIINNQVEHSGIQIIGWLLQNVPDLPPNDTPVASANHTTPDEVAPDTSTQSDSNFN